MLRDIMRLLGALLCGGGSLVLLLALAIALLVYDPAVHYWMSYEVLAFIGALYGLLPGMIGLGLLYMLRTKNPPG
ncbi:hypothetical protein [Maricaulis sp.]|uniref:hypothetical protein n=1 Tax=Maricaulis sp. TaxID=1486257 RepID=UPI00262CA69B|nr:hypothetical protein [Maricaulis sp.]